MVSFIVKSQIYPPRGMFMGRGVHAGNRNIGVCLIEMKGYTAVTL